MSTFVELAILLKKANALTIVDERYSDHEPYTEQDIIVNINNQKYLVSNIGGASDPNADEEQYKAEIAKKQAALVDKDHRYSRAFLNSINSKELPCINQEQNGEILFNAAYRVLRYLPAYCDATQDEIEDQNVEAELKKAVFALCGAWRSPLKIKLDPNRLEKEYYEEFFDCSSSYRNDTGLGSVRFAFRYQRGILGESEAEEYESQSISSPVESVDSFREWLNAHTLAGTPRKEEDLKTKALDSVRERLTDMMNRELVTNDYLASLDVPILNIDTLKVNSLKYRRILTYKLTAEAKLASNNSLAVQKNFEQNAVFVFEPKVIPTSLPINIFKCPTPSCTRFASMADKKPRMELHVDPNWRQSYNAVAGTVPSDEQGLFRHAVGCSACMTEECSFCKQRYYPYHKVAELNSFYGYEVIPTKAFLQDSASTKDEGVRSRLLSGVDKVADYCGCMKDIYWFYDEAYRAETGNETRTDRVLRNRDMVFINRLTKEVVAAYSPASYKAALEDVTKSFLTLDDGQQEPAENAAMMTAGQIRVFFSNFAEKRVGKGDALGKFRDSLTLPADISFMDKLDAASLDAYCTACNMTSDQKAEFLKEIEKEIKTLLEIFKKKLSKLSSMDGKDGHILYTSIYGCSLCKICGSLYFTKDEPNASVGDLPVKHDVDDACDLSNTGRWTTIRGAVLYKDKKNTTPHVSSRYVMTSKKEVSFAAWQKSIADSIIK